MTGVPVDFGANSAMLCPSTASFSTFSRTMYKQYIPSFISATDIFIADPSLERVSTGGRLTACA
jgi:hypothetical protein